MINIDEHAKIFLIVYYWPPIGDRVYDIKVLTKMYRCDLLMHAYGIYFICLKNFGNSYHLGIFPDVL